MCILAGDATTACDIVMQANVSGKVGVGAMNPSHKLTVTGDVCASSCMIATACMIADEFHGDGSNLTNVSGSSGWTSATNVTSTVCPTVCINPGATSGDGTLVINAASGADSYIKFQESK